MPLLDTLINIYAPDIQVTLSGNLKSVVRNLVAGYFAKKSANICVNKFTKGLDEVTTRFTSILPNDRATSIGNGFAQTVQTDFSTFGVTLNSYIQSKLKVELIKKQFGDKSSQYVDAITVRNNVHIKVINDFDALVRLVYGETLVD